jgi:hypothetical protein
MRFQRWRLSHQRLELTFGLPDETLAGLLASELRPCRPRIGIVRSGDEHERAEQR